MARRLAFEAFLSHRYKAPEVNLYFFDMFTQTASVQFRVDAGLRTLSTTQLERLIRSSDAFIGIYSIPGDPMQSLDRESLMQLSRYFRLELNMAIRSRKPSIVFCDDRYRNLFAALPGIQYCPYDAQEILSRSGSPARDGLRHQFRTFCRVVETASKLRAVARPIDDPGVVGILMPPAPNGHFDEQCLPVVEDAIRESGCRPEVLRWPLQLDLGALRALRACDWIIVETSSPESATLIAFLHGQFIPMMRIRRAGAVPEPDHPVTLAERTLFGGVDVGYNDELLVWEDADALRRGLQAGIKSVLEPGKRINDADVAEAYFRSAAQRKERVFLSYAGADEKHARVVGRGLRDRFQEVFDYRDGASIRHGWEWREEVFDSLSVTAVGVMLLSPAYLRSAYCREEANIMMNYRTEGRLQVFPIMVDDVDLPAYLSMLEYRDLRDHPAEELIAGIIEQLAPEQS
jgi:hypothetical protein